MERLASFPELNPNPVIEVDVRGVIIFYNDAASQTAEKLGLHDLREFLPADLGSIFTVAGQEWDAQFFREIKIKDEVFAVYIYCTPHSRQHALLYKYHRPKTGGGEAAPIRGNFRALYNLTPVMLQSINAEGRIVGVSDYWLETMGYDREEVIGRHLGDFLNSASQRNLWRINCRGLCKPVM